jgi:hypothetical protein
MSIEAMKQWRDALRKARRRILTTEECHAAITSINQAIAEAEKQEPVAYTTGHCKEKAQPNGCQLHNLHCGYPACDRKAVVNQQPKQEPVAYLLRRQDRSGYETGEKTDYGAFPVYTHPQPKREPMKQDDVARLWMKTRNYYKFARDLEAAHGIKENT